jgi:ABC-2 type transport system permease protein
MKKAKALIQKRIINIIKHEWRNTFSNLNSALFITLLPLIITAQALLLIYLVIRFAGAEALIKTVLVRGMENWLTMFPVLKELSLIEGFQVFFFNQFPFYLLLIPVMIAVSFATFSIVEEKQEKTLEPLLATPVGTWELLLSKALAGAIPSLLITWLCAGLFLMGIIWMDSGHLLKFVLNAQWFISLFLLVPLFSFLAFMFGVIASSRANDPKAAQNIAILVVLPILAIIGAQLTGFTIFAPVKLFILSVAIGILNFLVLRIAVHLFQRESIVVRWR